MYPKGLKHQVMEFLGLLLVVSFVVHLAGAWLWPAVPLLIILSVLGLLYRRKRPW
jgi:hypothetical protein